MRPTSLALQNKPGLVAWLRCVLQALRPLPRPHPHDAGPTSVLDTQQLRDAGLEAASDARLRDLGITRRPGPRIETAFSARRSVL